MRVRLWERAAAQGRRGRPGGGRSARFGPLELRMLGAGLRIGDRRELETSGNSGAIQRADLQRIELGRAFVAAQSVAHAAHGLNHVRAELFSKRIHIDVYKVRCRIE